MNAIHSRLPRKPETASARVVIHKECIMNRWADRVQREIAAARGQSKASLYDGLPAFLESLSETISSSPEDSGGERRSSENIQTCRHHGEQRARLGQYQLGDVIGEYRLLRQILFEELEKDGPLSVNERNQLLEAIDNGISQAAIAFTEIQGHQKDHAFRESRDLVGKLQSEKGLRESFVNTLTHDLKNPLTAAQVGLRLLKEQNLSLEKRERVFYRIEESIKRAEKMIHDLLDANRIQAGHGLVLHFERCELRSLASDILEEQASIHGDRFRLEAPQPIHGYWNPAGLRRILENLVGNAIKYGRQHSPVTVTLERKRQRVRIVVHNHLEGTRQVPTKQELMGLFEPFRRSNKQGVAAVQGWGIGLGLVRGIAEAHNGTASVESSAEKGTSFIVELPIDARTLT